MVAPIRDTGNITFHTSTLQTIVSNIALEFDIDMANGFFVDNIIFGNSSRGEQMRDHSLTSSNTRNRSNMPLIELDSRAESYHDKVQHKSNNMVEDDSVVMLNSP